MQPAAERGSANRAGAPREDEKCRLDGVLGVMWARQRALADAMHHRPMALDNDAEGRFIARLREAPHQFPIVDSAQALDIEHGEKRPQRTPEILVCHVLSL